MQPASASAQVEATSASAFAAYEDLTRRLAGMGLPEDVYGALLAPLDGFLDDLSAGEFSGAIKRLRRFIGRVENERGLGLSSAQAEDLVLAAEAAQAYLQAPSVQAGVETLVLDLQSLELSSGLSNKLLVHLTDLLRELDKGRLDHGVHLLNGFIADIDAASGDGISAEAAGDLMSQAGALVTVLQSPQIADAVLYLLDLATTAGVDSRSLEIALADLARGRVDKAIDQLGVFIQEVQQAMANGLPTSLANTLITLAQSAQKQLGGGAPSRKEPPVVSSVLPLSGQPVGGYPLTIGGANFSTSARVFVGGEKCTNVVYIDSRTLSCTAPALPEGLYAVSVENTGKLVGTLSDAFLYTTKAPALLGAFDGADPITGGIYDFGLRPIGTFTSHELSVTNDGELDATSFAFAVSAGPFTIIGGTCLEVVALAAQQSCTLLVAFAPSASGAVSGHVVLSHVDGAWPTTLEWDLVGQGAIPATLTVSDGPAYDYGIVAIGASRAWTFTVAYSGEWPASGLSIQGLASPFEVAATTCGPVLTADCEISVTFAPTAAQSVTDTLSVAYDDGVAAREATRDVSGTGVYPARLVVYDGLVPINEGVYDFGALAIGGTLNHEFVVVNEGDLPATAVDVFVAAPFVVSGGTCLTLASIESGASCTMVLDFAPNASGQMLEWVTLSYDNGAGMQVAAWIVATGWWVQGQGAIPASLVWSDAPGYDFGTVTVGAQASYVLTLEYSGEWPATGVAVQGVATPFSVLSTSCGSELTANCEVTVAFTPAAAGAFSETLIVGYDDGVTSRVATREITGTGGYSAPTILSVSPNHGLSGTTITLTGNNFRSGIAVGLDASSCGNVVLISDQSLTCVTPAHAPGAANVTATNADGQSTTLSGGFTYDSTDACPGCRFTIEAVTTPNMWSGPSNFYGKGSKWRVYKGQWTHWSGHLYNADGSPAANQPFRFWVDAQIGSWADVTADGMTDANGAYAIQTELKPGAGKYSSVVYKFRHYYDIDTVKVSTGGTQIYTTTVYHLAYSVYR